MAREQNKHVALLEGKTYTALQVRKLVYTAFKAGQGGHATDGWSGRLGLANRRLHKLKTLFPKLFPEKLKKKAA